VQPTERCRRPTEWPRNTSKARAHSITRTRLNRDLQFLCECIIHVTALKLALDREQVLVVCTSGDIIVEILKWFFGSLFNRFFYPLDVIPTLDCLNNVIRIFGAFDEVIVTHSLSCVIPSLYPHMDLEIAIHIEKSTSVPNAEVTGDKIGWRLGNTT
jgi:hypothetical protein